MGYLIIAAIIVFILRLPSVRGFFGELAIRIWLKFLDKKRYKVLNNIIIPSEDGSTAQIDHIVVSVYGIFVIETKNYKGWIFGSEKSRQWTQVLYKTKNQFYNPILQNKGHVEALKNLLSEYPFITYIPVVVFTSKASLKRLDVTSHVVYSFGLYKTIRSYTDIIISETDLEKIVQIILSANSKRKTARREHISRIKSNKIKYEKAKMGICPWCGGRLTERTGKYGKFKGCSNFPGCRFVLKGSKK